MEVEDPEDDGEGRQLDEGHSPKYKSTSWWSVNVDKEWIPMDIAIVSINLKHCCGISWTYSLCLRNSL